MSNSAKGLIISVNIQKCDEIYGQLEVEMVKPDEETNFSKLMFLAGAVHGLRLATNFEYNVPEIELAMIRLKKHFGEEGVEIA